MAMLCVWSVVAEDAQQDSRCFTVVDLVMNWRRGEGGCEHGLYMRPHNCAIDRFRWFFFNEVLQQKTPLVVFAADFLTAS